MANLAQAQMAERMRRGGSHEDQEVTTGYWTEGFYLQCTELAAKLFDKDLRHERAAWCYKQIIEVLEHLQEENAHALVRAHSKSVVLV